MKTKFFIPLFLLFIGLTVNAQIDRSKQPKPGPAPEIQLGKPQTFKLNNGLKVLVVENHKLPRVNISLTLDNAPYLEGTKAGVSDVFAGMIGNGTTSISKDAYNEEVDFLGASINFSGSGAFANTLSKYFPRVLTLMADGTLNPLLTEEEFQKEKDKMIEGLKTDEKSVTAAARRVEAALAYGKTHPYGEFVSEETVKNITLQDIQTFYQNFFVPENAYLAIVGDVKFEDVKKLVESNFSSWKIAVAPNVSYSIPKDVQYTQINFVDMPNAVQSEIAVENLIKVKLSDPDYFPLLIANNILGGGANARLFLNLREDKGFTYGAYSRVGNDKRYPVRFVASASVRNAVTDSSVVEFIKEIKKIRDEKVTADDLKSAKAEYAGSFVMSLENPQTQARFALNILTENLPQNFYETYLAKINAVTVEDVQRVAKKYFQADHLRIVITGKATEVLPGLQALNIPIFYFDKYANPTENPLTKKTETVNISTDEILEKYFKAIGGREKAVAVKTIYRKGSAVGAAPFPILFDIRSMTPNKEVQTLSAEGMGTLQKVSFNGESGYQEAQGQKKVLEGEELAKQKASRPIFPELFFKAEGYKLSVEGVEKLDAGDAYKVKVTSPDGKDTYRYYGKESGLLLQTEDTMEMQGMSLSQTEELSDYKEVNGVKIPFVSTSTVGPQKIKVVFSEIKINEGVSEADFN
ncbi:MAG: peptidase M16 [Bacteroidetes bacterium HGW-Bacteroidetes-13]|nr:MAG: peptidase M16 [Bacteroidetes bacterium HGW-Bacteroidetes-13]